MKPAAPPALRRATVADAAAALQWTPAADALHRWAGPSAGFPTTPERFWREIHVKGYVTFALEFPGEGLAGFGQVRLRDETFGHLARIVVDPAQRGQGHGRTLCHALMREALRLHPGITGFSLYVFPANAPALALYRSLGFVERGLDEEHGCLLMAAPRSGPPAP